MFVYYIGKKNNYINTQLSDTIEIYGGQNYEASWKLAPFHFVTLSKYYDFTHTPSPQLPYGSSNIQSQNRPSATVSPVQSSTFQQSLGQTSVEQTNSNILPIYDIGNSNVNVNNNDNNIIFAEVGVDVLRPPGSH